MPPAQPDVRAGRWECCGGETGEDCRTDAMTISACAAVLGLSWGADLSGADLSKETVGWTI